MWQDEPALRKTVADAFIREWARLGCEEGVAFKLYTEATPFQLVSSDAIFTLAQACLRDGLTLEAFTCLVDPVFGDEPKARFTIALLGRLRNGAVRGLPEDMATTLGRAMRDVAMGQSYLVHARQWEWNMSVLARSNCASLAVDVALVLAERHPQLCSRRWWTAFMHQLCNQRLFCITLRLIRGMPKLHDAQRAMCLGLIRRLAHASKPHLARQAWDLLAPGRVPAPIMLMKTVGFQELGLTKQDTRPIIPFLFPLGQPRHSSLKAYLLGLRLLCRSELHRPAKRLYKYIQSTGFDPALKGVASNTLLTGFLRHSRRRNARQLRDLLKLLNRLVTEDGFVPDRVTLNILLKSILRWRIPVDSQKLRVLFDRVVSSGYPTSYFDPTPKWQLRLVMHKTELPFGTPTVLVRPLPPMVRGSSALGGPLEFERHVRPLYKMFVRAFRDRKDWEAAVTVGRILASVKRSKDALKAG